MIRKDVLKGPTGRGQRWPAEVRGMGMLGFDGIKMYGMVDGLYYSYPPVQ
jgi:hypothetical protein